MPDVDLFAAHFEQLRLPRYKRELLAAFDDGEALHWQVDRADMFADHTQAFKW